jgi:ABC-2 type transport system ATP-binding protein
MNNLARAARDIRWELSGGRPSLAGMTSAIEVQALVKVYDGVRALDGLDFTVPEGTVLGLLGPNGAGKTTCVRILTTLLKPTSGHATVGGIDVVHRPQEVRRIIGLSGQYAAVDEYLTGYENLVMIGRLYHLGTSAAKQRADELLERFELTDAANRPVKTYSGGMRRRLDLAGALVARPPIIFMDEPTTGLDPRSRLGLWETIGERVRQGSTLLLTTQHMEEADQLADDIIVLDKGKAIAHGTPDQLKRQIGGERLEVRVTHRADLTAATAILKAVGNAEPTVDPEAHLVAVPVNGGVAALTEAVRQLDAADVEPADIGVRRPTLDDVFLQLTGRAVSTEEGSSS